jgi:hypothetical protein
VDGPTEYHEEYDFGFGLHTILDGVERLIGTDVTVRPA